MKKIFLGMVLSIAICFTSCEDDDGIVIVKPKVNLLTPENGSTGVDVAPTFTWQATDPDGQELTYDFMIGFDSLNLLMQATGLKEASYTLTDYALSKQKQYYWKVVAHNQANNTGESDIWNFSSLNAPGAPDIVGPVEGAYVRSTLVFEWGAVEASEGEKIQYEVYLGTDKQNLEKVATVDGETTYEYDASLLEIGKVYYWAVSSSDLISGNMSQVSSFEKLMPGAPDKPQIISPEHKASLYDSEIQLSWDAANDPEGDVVTYDVYYGELEPTTLLTSDLAETSFNAIGLENKAYAWKVVAKDPSGNYTESSVAIFSKIVTGAPTAPALADLKQGSILSLDEAFSWNECTDPDGQAVTYDVYLDEIYPPVKQLAAGITDLQFVAKNADLACDITNVKTFYAMVVAKDEDGNESKSKTIAFKPQMTGVFTDIRGDEVENYNWVRIGPKVWMSDNLRTKKFTTGADIANVGGTTLLSGKSVNDQCFWDEYPHTEVYSGNWVADFGRVYTYGCIYHDDFAPSGWHVMDKNDQSELKSYVGGNVYDLTSPFHITSDGALQGNNKYGLNFRSAGWRYPTNFRTDGVFLDRPDLWVDNSDASVLELRLFNGEWRFFQYDTKMMFGIRLVKNE